MRPGRGAWGLERKTSITSMPSLSALLVLACYKYLRVARQFQHQWHGNLTPSSCPLLDHSSLVWEGFSQRAGLKGGWMSSCVQCAQCREKTIRGLCKALMVLMFVLSAPLRSIPVSSPFLPSCHLPFSKDFMYTAFILFSLMKIV